VTEVIIAPDSQTLGRLAADAVADALPSHGTPVIGVATGSSPLVIYAELGRRVRRGELDLSATRGFALDEYVGLSEDDPQSYATFVRTVIEKELQLAPGAISVPDGRAPHLAAGAAAYDRAIGDAGGIDVQILGIGSNGHVGFNEPGSSLSSRTRVKALAESTRRDNARFFDHPGDVPTLCITQGLGTIGRARRLVLVAMGESKAAAVAAAVEGPISSSCPASIVQLHPAATVIVDEEAAGMLRHDAYYRTSARLAGRL
jgi:glucosamine-6-phosphate deaminase